MSATTSLQCQLLCACGCAYGISGTTYTPPSPYNDAVNWVGTPTAFTGGTNNINAALVGIAGLNINGTVTNSVVIAFRGTLPPTSPFTVPELEDWFQDFMAEPVTAPSVPGMVHSGFLDAVNTILTGIINQVNSLTQNNPMPVYITGHSKGGGMTSVTAALMAFNYPTMTQPTALYTFASPMAGNTQFVSGFPSSIPVYRYENNLDIVPFLPPSAAVIAELEKIPIIGQFFAQAAGWDYTPLGQLNFIFDGVITQPASNPCWPLILAELLDGVIGGSGFSNIAAAHSHACGGGYMGGTCPTGVCPS